MVNGWYGLGLEIQTFPDDYTIAKVPVLYFKFKYCCFQVLNVGWEFSVNTFTYLTAIYNQ